MLILQLWAALLNGSVKFYVCVWGHAALSSEGELESLQACLPSRPNTHPSPVTSAIWHRVNLHSGVHKQPGSSQKATQRLWSLTGISISGRWWTRLSNKPRSHREHIQTFLFNMQQKVSQQCCSCSLLELHGQKGVLLKFCAAFRLGNHHDCFKLQISSVMFLRLASISYLLMLMLVNA